MDVEWQSVQVEEVGQRADCIAEGGWNGDGVEHRVSWCVGFAPWWEEVQLVGWRESRVEFLLAEFPKCQVEELKLGAICSRNSRSAH